MLNLLLSFCDGYVAVPSAVTCEPFTYNLILLLAVPCVESLATIICDQALISLKTWEVVKSATVPPLEFCSNQVKVFPELNCNLSSSLPPSVLKTNSVEPNLHLLTQKDNVHFWELVGVPNVLVK